MKITHVINEFFPPDKGYTDPYYYIRYLARLGHELTVLSGRKGHEQEEEFREKIRIWRTPFIFHYGSRWDSIRFILFIIRSLKQIKTDLVHIYYFDLSFIVHLFLKMFCKKIKVVCDIRSIALKRKITGTWLRRIASWSADHTIVLDEQIASQIFGKRSDQGLYFLPLGADLSSFSRTAPSVSVNIRRQYQIRPDDILFISIGTLDHLRQQHIVIRAFQKAGQKMKKVRLMFIGNGPEKENLVRLSRQLSLQERIIFIDIQPHLEIPKYLKAADIGLTYLPIALYDPQPPLKTAEYLAAGIPVIAADTQGNRKFIRDNYNGLLIRDNETALADAMILLGRDKKLRMKLKGAALKSIRPFDYANIVKRQLIPIYQEIMK